MKHALWALSLPVLAPATLLSPIKESTAETLSRRDFNRTEYRALPQCVANCVDSVTTSNDCKPSDTTCFCTRGNITATYTACIQSSCMMPADQLEGARYQAHTCNYPYRTRQPLHRGVLWTTFAVATLFFALRMFSRMPALQGSGFSWDDHVMIFTYGMAVVVAVATELTLVNGSGLDEWRLTPEQISRYMLVYGRPIESPHPSASRAGSSLRFSSFPSLRSTSCVPVSSTWNYIQGEKGICINLPALTYSYGAVSVSYDVLIFFLPIHSLLKLNITWQKKVGVCAVFLVGFVVTIIAIVRLQYLVRFHTKQNATWVYQTISMWSIIEINFSIVATCMPATAGLLQRLWRWSHGESLSTSTGYVAKQSQIPPTTADDTLIGSHDEKSPKSDLESGNSRTDLADCETALAQGEVDGRVQREMGGPGTVTETHNPSSAAEVLSRHHPDSSSGATALVHQSHIHGGNGGQNIQISHEPPSQPAEAELQYRDDRDVLHRVVLRDVPEGRMPGIRSRERRKTRRDLTGLRAEV
ncbi:hypothetical protein M409DRAFT_52112 [Zasmidium cellare ATCC 36951]|uniref:CFEM domain-containing protein n=1 Tax=Zasmidium cellare ATCC 36951 TaxID=1080233 RepID=A0A6A6CTU5_ZASCE|nr:uncharacterized protein M409DRAFT_52112 [Zasmidium cellare ATCC 36951]KAF2169580.1 hypothetical protein M409DRAFT_52112 [Zasmidium cellare ATCC 36951]